MSVNYMILSMKYLKTTLKSQEAYKIYFTRKYSLACPRLIIIYAMQMEMALVVICTRYLEMNIYIYKR